MSVNIDGTAFRFFDTAGIRESVDIIENMGIERSYNKLEQAEIVLLVNDISNPLPLILERIEKIRQRIETQKLIIVANKADLVKKETLKRLIDSIHLQENEDIVFISAKNHQNIESLIGLLKGKSQFAGFGYRRCNCFQTSAITKPWFMHTMQLCVW